MLPVNFSSRHSNAPTFVVTKNFVQAASNTEQLDFVTLIYDLVKCSLDYAYILLLHDEGASAIPDHDDGVSATLDKIESNLSLTSAKDLNSRISLNV